MTWFQHQAVFECIIVHPWRAHKILSWRFIFSLQKEHALLSLPAVVFLRRCREIVWSYTSWEMFWPSHWHWLSGRWLNLMPCQWLPRADILIVILMTFIIHSTTVLWCSIQFKAVTSKSISLDVHFALPRWMGMTNHLGLMSIFRFFTITWPVAKVLLPVQLL